MSATRTGRWRSCSPSIGIVDSELQVLRSVESVWDRLRAGVRLVPREFRSGLQAIDRLRALDPPDVPTLYLYGEETNVMVFARPDEVAELLPEAQLPGPSGAAASGVRLRPDVVRPSGAAVHHRSRRVTVVGRDRPAGPGAAGETEPDESECVKVDPCQEIATSFVVAGSSRFAAPGIHGRQPGPAAAVLGREHPTAVPG